MFSEIYLVRNLCQGCGSRLQHLTSNGIYYSFLFSPVGKLGIASSKRGVFYLRIGVKEKYFLTLLKKSFSDVLVESEEKNRKLKEELKYYFEGKLKVFSCELDLTYGTPFQVSIWNALKEIPYGEVRSYKTITIKTGNKNSYRAVGGAISRNPIPIIIPCHRVIGSDGNLRGYSEGKDIKRKLLKMEGAFLP